MKIKICLENAEINAIVELLEIPILENWNNSLKCIDTFQRNKYIERYIFYSGIKARLLFEIEDK
jgi:hypothetical protein